MGSNNAENDLILRSDVVMVRTHPLPRGGTDLINSGKLASKVF